MIFSIHLLWPIIFALTFFQSISNSFNSTQGGLLDINLSILILKSPSPEIVFLCSRLVFFHYQMLVFILLKVYGESSQMTKRPFFICLAVYSFIIGILSILIQGRSSQSFFWLLSVFIKRYLLPTKDHLKLVCCCASGML